MICFYWTWLAPIGMAWFATAFFAYLRGRMTGWKRHEDGLAGLK